MNELELSHFLVPLATLAAFIVYLLSSMGYIDPELSKAITTLISNPEVQSAVEQMAD